jgi:hypothetical protein
MEVDGPEYMISISPEQLGLIGILMRMSHTQKAFLEGLYPIHKWLIDYNWIVTMFLQA